MIDYVGQETFSTWSKIITFFIAIPLSLIIGFLTGNFLYSINTIFIFGLVNLILFVPPWPFLCSNPEVWREDKDYFEMLEKRKKSSQIQMNSSEGHQKSD